MVEGDRSRGVPASSEALRYFPGFKGKVRGDLIEQGRFSDSRLPHKNSGFRREEWQEIWDRPYQVITDGAVGFHKRQQLIPAI